MTLIDTNVILNLLHRDARERQRTQRDITGIRDTDFGITAFVLSEVCSFLCSAREYVALETLLLGLNIKHVESEQFVTAQDVLKWMQKYASHRPDFADAHLVLLCSKLPKCRVWTYDQEFVTQWRRPDGSAVPMAVKN